MSLLKNLTVPLSFHENPAIHCNQKPGGYLWFLPVLNSSYPVNQQSCLYLKYILSWPTSLPPSCTRLSHMPLLCLLQLFNSFILGLTVSTMAPPRYSLHNTVGTPLHNTNDHFPAILKHFNSFLLTKDKIQAHYLSLIGLHDLPYYVCPLFSGRPPFWSWKTQFFPVSGLWNMQFPLLNILILWCLSQLTSSHTSGLS